MAQTGRRSTTSGRRKTAPPEPLPGLDRSSLNDISGIALAAAGVALMLAVLGAGSEAAVAVAVSNAVKSALGVGAYVVPVLLVLWGVSFFVNRHVDITEWRVGAGLGIVLVSLVALVALSVPVELQWDEAVVQRYGGFVGASFAWVFRTPLGGPIAGVVLVALLLIGLVVTGLSISGAVAWAWQTMRRPEAEPGKAERPAPVRKTKVAQAADETFAEPPPAARRPGAAASDPEEHRKTLPSTKPVAPRAMEGFVLPPTGLLALTPAGASKHQATEKELRETSDVIEQTLATFDITARVVGWVPGPTVTMFEVQLAKGVKVHAITRLSDDLALALAASTIRILAPIPGKSLVGVEVPNDRRSTVTLGDLVTGAPTPDAGPLELYIGKDVAGDVVTGDLSAMPHLLIAGATGTGKSVCINALLVSILLRATPAEVRLILIDPKRIELALYNSVPHLYVPVVTEPKEAASALAWAVSEMDSRLKRLQKAGARNIAQYNALVHEGRAPEGFEALPYLVICIDELADLMMVAAKEVEDSICRIAQLARAAGIHLIVATQRPSTDIITGLIKTNITNRIAFAVASAIDSRVILDQPGAEKLVGLGDMLFSTPAWPKPKRIQGAYVSEPEIEAVVAHLKEQAEPDYHEEILHLKVAAAGGGVDYGEEDDDPLLWEAADIVVTTGMGSTSLLQRRLKVGYARAGRIMDMLEAKGVVGPPDGSKPREVIVDIEDLEALKAFERQEADDEFDLGIDL